MKSKTLVALLVLICPAAHAAENAYDLLGHVLSSFVDVFAAHPKGEDRAITIALRLDEMTGLPKESAGMQAGLWVEAPDKFKLYAPIGGQPVTICRNGQKLWVSPGTAVAAMLEALSASGRISEPDPKFRLSPMKLPLPENQLVFLPALFQIDDQGLNMVDGKECRSLGLELSPPIARSLGAQGWSGHLDVTDSGTPARLTLTQKKGWHVALSFESVTFSKTLPPETWTPSAAEAVDVREITPSEYSQILSAILAKKKKKAE